MKVEKVFEGVDGKTIKVELHEPDYKDHLNYMFNVGIAQRYGLDEAIILNNLIYWIEQNKANCKNFYDGYYWTYNSVKAFLEIYPFWSKGQITRVLASLEAKNVIKSGNYNKVGYDRTKWYTIIDIAISRNQEINLPETANQFTGNERPIPLNNTPVKPLDNLYIQKVIEIYPKRDPMTKRITGIKKNDKIKKKIENIVKEFGEEKLLEITSLYIKDCLDTKSYIKNFETYLNNFASLKDLLEDKTPHSAAPPDPCAGATMLFGDDKGNVFYADADGKKFTVKNWARVYE